MNDNHKYGLTAMVIWLIFSTSIILGYAEYHNMSFFEYFLDEETGGFISVTMFAAWAAIWYALGFNARKKYVKSINAYIKEYPSIEEETLRKMFKHEYLAKNSKILSRIFVTAIPIWLLLNIYTLSTHDYVIMCAFGVCALFCYIYNRMTIKMI